MQTVGFVNYKTFYKCHQYWKKQDMVPVVSAKYQRRAKELSWCRSLWLKPLEFLHQDERYSKVSGGTASLTMNEGAHQSPSK
jgi:hypothetical protein